MKPSRFFLRCSSHIGSDACFAYQAMCPHEAIPLEAGVCDGSVVTCLEHLWQFDVRTGESVFLRSVKPLVTYPTTVRDGRVFVEVPLAAAEAGSRWVGAER